MTAWHFYRWLTRAWWRHLLAGCKGWRHFRCRLRGHPRGVVWYNVGGSEPDMRCRDCGEYLG
jgi:hypothetical protein